MPKITGIVPNLNHALVLQHRFILVFKCISDNSEEIEIFNFRCLILFVKIINEIRLSNCL
jgi:hypothetical protein